MSFNAMSAAVTGAQAQEIRIANIANNVANVNTVAYKKVESTFSDLYYSNIKKAGILENSEAAPRPLGIQLGMGTKVTGTYRNMERGSFRQTSFPLDVAISTSGYFAITLPNGRVGYTRAGAFQKDSATGNIVTADGNSLEAAIAIPAGVPTEQIQISSDGAISYTDPNNPSISSPIGEFQLYTFPNESGLESIGDNLLIETPGSGERIAVDDMTGAFKQGFLEESNVSAVEELTNLIAAQRNYELNTRVMSTVDKILESINNIK